MTGDDRPIGFSVVIPIDEHVHVYEQVGFTVVASAMTRFGRAVRMRVEI